MTENGVSTRTRIVAGLVVAGVIGALVLLFLYAPQAGGQEERNPFGEGGSMRDERFLAQFRSAAISLPVATLLGAALAFRPRRRGTPPRDPAVIQTQIILAIVGAVVMLVVGASLARAFGIVGVASLIRYRSKIDDPKDAGVMLSTLGIGLASGVGLYGLATFSTAFILGALWLIESLEPEASKIFEVRIKTKEAEGLRSEIENLIRRYATGFELRTASNEELSYEVELPMHVRIDRISNALLKLDPKNEMAVDWDEKKKKKSKIS
jgi:hypothetical protein